MTTINKQINEHLYDLFTKFKDMNIPGDFIAEIRASSNSGSRDVKVIYHVAVGDWNNRAEFDSSTIDAAFAQAIALYHNKKAHAPVLLTGPEEVEF